MPYICYSRNYLLRISLLRYTPYSFESWLSLCKCSKKAQPRCPEISAVYPICCTSIYSVKKYPFPFVSMPLT
ncbi:hypothetical protein HMPREF1553_01238 [Porphyromonas gingivalis F0568]|nr:hypothetical protein HMPREF1553_01238 [Porphyromonas gingivalis F0568]